MGDVRQHVPVQLVWVFVRWFVITLIVLLVLRYNDEKYKVFHTYCYNEVYFVSCVFLLHACGGNLLFSTCFELINLKSFPPNNYFFMYFSLLEKKEKYFPFTTNYRKKII